MKGISNNINKKYILEHVSQIAIFSKYLDISDTIITNCIERNTLIISPIRPYNAPDNDGSCGFRYDNKGKLKMRDFGGYFWGDCFDLVCLILNKSGYNFSVSNPKDFIYILNHIAIQFSIKDGIPESVVNLKEAVHKVKSSTCVIDIEPREWNNNDVKVWCNKHHNLITLQDLTKEYTYPVELFWIDSKSQPNPKYYYTYKDPCYAYYQGQYGGVNLIRLYFPLRSGTGKSKFITNNSAMQGLLTFNGLYDIIIITKSMKDVIIIKKLIEASYFSLRGLLVGVIALPSENYKMNNTMFEWILSHLKVKDIGNIISFLDFDKIGRITSKYNNDVFGMPYMFLTRGELGLPDYGAKDPSEFIERFNIKPALNIINDIYEKKFANFE